MYFDGSPQTDHRTDRVGLFKIKAHRQDAALLRLRATWLPLRSVEAQRPLAPVLTTHLLDSITTIPYFTHIKSGFCTGWGNKAGFLFLG